MSALSQIELFSDDEGVVALVSAAAAASGRSFALSVPRDPWSEPRGHSARIVDLVAVAHLAQSLAFVGANVEGFVLVLPADEARPCTRFHVYPRTALSELLEDLLRELPESHEPAGRLLLGASRAMSMVREQIASVAAYADVSVMVCGETGTGKELVAQTIHQRSARPGAFVAINCAAVPETLFESELFGHEAGSFTGARNARAGLLETAAQGTIFLDEIGEMPPPLQAKLLRVIETRTFRRLGANRDLVLDARVVSATNRPLREAGGDRHLRRDLLYRLAGFVIELPPLRDRSEDIAQLATAFLDSFVRRHRRSTLRFRSDALETLGEQRWPGNVRQLRAVVEQVAIVATNPSIERGDVLRALQQAPAMRTTTIPPPDSPRRPAAAKEPFSAKSSGVRRAPLRDLERELILSAFEAAKGNLSRAAADLGIPRTTLRDKLRRYGVLVRAAD